MVPILLCKDPRETFMNATTSSQIRIIAGLLAAGFLMFAFQNCGRTGAMNSGGGLSAGLTTDLNGNVQGVATASYLALTEEWKSAFKAVSLFKPTTCTDTGSGDFCEQVIVDKTYSTVVESFIDANGALWVQNVCGSYSGTVQPRALASGEILAADTAALQVVGLTQQSQLNCSHAEMKDLQEVAFELTKSSLLREANGGLEIVTTGGARLGLSH